MSKEQQYFLEKAKEGYSIFLTGKAGTGKTFVLSQFTDWLKEQKKELRYSCTNWNSSL